MDARLSWVVCAALICGCASSEDAPSGASGGTAGLGGSGGTTGSGGTAGSGGAPLACDKRFSFSVATPVEPGVPFNASFTDLPGYTNVGMNVTGPGAPKAEWIGVTGSSPYTWSYAISGHDAGVLALTFSKDVTTGSAGTEIASCEILSQPGPDGGGSSTALQWIEVSAPPTSVNFEERFGAAVGSCLFAWDRDGSTTHVAKQIEPGKLGAWTTTTSPPGGPTYDTWAVAVQNQLFVGTLTSGCFSCYYLATIDPSSCAITAWSKLGGVPQGYGGPWMGAALGGTGSVYALGGVYGDANQKGTGMWGAISGGTIAWQPIDDIGGVATTPSAVVVQNHLYVFGGGTDNNVNNGPTSSSVRVASLASNGAPGAFTDAAELWPGRGIVVAATSKYVYAIGGVAAPSGGFTHALRASRAPITSNGLGAWQELPSLVSSLPKGFGVGYLPYAQVGSLLYAFAGVDYPDVTNWGFEPNRVFAVQLE